MGALQQHHQRRETEVPGHGRLLTSAAVRGFPGAAPGLTELLDALPGLAGRVADVTGSAGGGALASAAEARVHVLEPSYAGWRAARERFAQQPQVDVAAGLPWELGAGDHDAVLLLPPTDRGNDRVRAELAAAARALRSTGVAYAAMHKDQGGRRYERDAGAFFAEVSVVRRSRGWRVVRLAGPRQDGGDGATPWRRFEALGRSWWALPGVFAARGLDVGSGVLLEALAALGEAPLAGAAALDLGCGTGVLSHAARAAGASAVVALDDDLAAVASARRNLADDAVRVLHSDLDAELASDERFDAVVVNPPFHVGKQVRWEVSRAFLAAARARLRDGGVAIVVANQALPYERELASWRSIEVLLEARGFKVLRAWR